jgi:L-arabinose isomerase
MPESPGLSSSVTSSLNARPLRPRLGIVVSSWPHEDGAGFARQLVGLIGEVAPADELEAIVYPQPYTHEREVPAVSQFFADKRLDAACIVPGNFTLDHIIPLLAEALHRPAVLWGLADTEAWGALVGLQQTLVPFKELGMPYRFVVGHLRERKAWDKIVVYARASAMVQRMKGMRIGLMGFRAEGMSDVMFDELALRETFGIQIVNVGLTRYSRAVDAVTEAEAMAAWREMAPGFDPGVTPLPVILHGVRSHVALQRLIAEENLQAFSVECFHDHLGGPCLGKSIANDQGVAASCESDIPGAVMMAAMQLLSGEPTFHSDFNRIYFAENAGILHHCGNLPRRLAAHPETLGLLPIPEHIGPGAYGPTIQATMKATPVTLTNLVGRRGTLRVAAMEGEAVPYELEYPGSAAKVVFPFDLGEALEAWGNAGFGHHYAVVVGHVARQTAEWCQLLGVPFQQFGV